MKKITLITLIFTLLISCSKEIQTSSTPTTPKIYAPLFKKNVQWEFTGYKFTKSKDTSYFDPNHGMNQNINVGGNIILGSRVIMFDDFRVNTRRNGNNTGPNACNDYDCKLTFGGGFLPTDSSFISIYNQYNNSLGHCAMFQLSFKIINFTDSTMTVFYFYNTNNKIPEDVEMYYLKIYK